MKNLTATVLLLFLAARGTTQDFKFSADPVLIIVKKGEEVEFSFSRAQQLRLRSASVRIRDVTKWAVGTGTLVGRDREGNALVLTAEHLVHSHGRLEVEV